VISLLCAFAPWRDSPFNQNSRGVRKKCSKSALFAPFFILFALFLLFLTLFYLFLTVFSKNRLF